MKSTSLSVRVSDDDAAFLARLEIADATTPSEKLRALLRAERDRTEGGRDPLRAADVSRDLLAGALRKIKILEAKLGIRSGLVRETYDRLPDIMGRAIVGVADGTEDAESRAQNFEAELVDELFDLLHVTVELGMSPQRRVYDASALEGRLTALLNYVLVFGEAKEKLKETDNV